MEQGPKKTKASSPLGLGQLKRQVEMLQARAQKAEANCRELKRRLEDRCRAYETEFSRKSRVEENLRLAEVIIDNSHAILFRRLGGDNPQLVYVSPNISRIGYTADEFLSGQATFRRIVHPDDGERVHTEILGYAKAGVEEYDQEYRIVTRSGEVRWVEDHTSVVRDARTGVTYNQGLVIDVSERKQVEEQLRKSEEKHRRIVETAAEGFILMDQNLRVVDVNAAYCRMIGYSRDEMLGKTPLDLASQESAEFLLAHRDALLNQDTREFEGTVIAKDGRRIPILVHGSTLRDDGGKVIGNMAFVTDMTEHKKALALAAEVQKSLLPQRGISDAGVEVFGRNISCDEIGGDYYDFLWQRPSGGGPLSVVVGDITGHGVDSALLMTTARAFLRMRASQPGTIADIIGAMNRHLADDVLESGRFMTLFFLAIDPVKQRIEWVRAGHEPAMLYDPDKDRFEDLRGEGMALGIDREFNYQVNRRSGLQQGQVITVGTDGIWEARNRNGEMFGRQRFQAIVRRHASGSAEEILNAAFAHLADYTRGTRSEDDITLVVVKIGRESSRAQAS